MKKILSTVLVLMSSVIVCVAQERKLELTDVRNDVGTIYVMMEKGGETPVYLMAKAVAGTTVIALPEMKTGEWLVSVLHDENENRNMDFTEDKKAKEGFARMPVQIKEGEAKNLSVRMIYLTE
ncbi:MAG: DUF2141 domain-containing protein [Phocaeicola sp.]|nr:DUF2141 domain-containing protein [Phocaeicola sp.]MDD7447693.1 DUF2141 domain-containing protein [Prevotellaceae bacterium]MDY5939745.1 DUF2141 domain-containing protein [Phocaeicola sp.]